MHRLPEFASVATLVLLLAACSGAEAPPPAADATAGAPTTAPDPKANPLAGTALESQGAAMQKAKGVEDTLQQSAEQRRAEIDEQAQ
jgi:hypothetical protein